MRGNMILFIKMPREDTLTILKVIGALCLSFTSATQIQVRGNEDGITRLPCDHGQNTQSIIIITWYRVDNIQIPIAGYNHVSRVIVISASWRGRVNFTVPLTAGALEISSTRLDDEANYRCSVITVSNTINLCVNLTVFVNPYQLAISGTDVPFKEGDNILVTCKVTRVKPAYLVTITWSIQNNPPITGVTSSTRNPDGKTFNVENNAALAADRQQDGKTLTCHVSWNKTTDFTTATKTLSVNYPPRSVRLTSGGNTRIRQGTLVSMTCQIDAGGAKPLPTLSIYRQGITSPVKTQDNTPQMTHTMTVQRDDNGRTFQCRATGGVITGSINSQSVTYHVLYPASSVTVTGVSGPVIEGTAVTLDCYAVDGNPDTYTYKWAHVRNGQRTDLTVTTSRLTLCDIQYTAAGRYICQATNEYGPTEGDKEVIVHYSPKIDQKNRPTFNVGAKTGDTKNLTMYIIALPANVVYTWFHGDKQMESEKVKNNGLNSMLMLVNITESDFGNYICKASNVINQPSEFMFFLLAMQPPLPPEDVVVTRRTAVSLTIKWKRSFDGGFKQHFKVRYRKSGTYKFKETNPIKDPFPDSRYTQTKLTPLDPRTHYELYVVAFSVFNGGSETPSGTVTAVTPGRPHINSEKFIVDRRGSDAKLTWTRPTGQYTHYVVEWCEKPDNTNCKSKNEGNETTRTVISGLCDGQEYSFVMRVYDGEDQVSGSVEFHPVGWTFNPLPVAIPVPIVLIAIIIATAAVVTVIVIRRLKTGGSARHKKDAKMKGSSRGEHPSISPASETEEYEEPFGNKPHTGTSRTADYLNAAFHAGKEEGYIASKMSNSNQQSPLYENMKAEAHVYEDVGDKPSQRNEPTYINEQGGAQNKQTGGEYEQ